MIMMKVSRKWHTESARNVLASSSSVDASERRARESKSYIIQSTRPATDDVGHHFYRHLRAIKSQIDQIREISDSTIHTHVIVNQSWDFDEIWCEFSFSDSE